MNNTQRTDQEPGSDKRIQATARLDQNTYEFYQEWAQREERSMSQVLRLALERYQRQAQQPQECSQ